MDLLHAGVGVHPNDIFCSSLPGMDIPTGAAFVGHIKSQVTHPELVLMIITPAFLKSPFCSHEVGASWRYRCRSGHFLLRHWDMATWVGYWPERKLPN